MLARLGLDAAVCRSRWRPTAAAARCAACTTRPIRTGVQDAVVHARARCSTCSSTSAPDEPTYGRWVSVELAADEPVALHVPPGIAHGYQTLEDDSAPDLRHQHAATYPRARAACAGTTRRSASHWPLAGDGRSRSATGRRPRGRRRPDHRGERPDRRGTSCEQWDVDGLRAAGRRPRARRPARARRRRPRSCERVRPAVVVHLAWAASGTPGYRALRGQRALGRRVARARTARAEDAGRRAASRPAPRSTRRPIRRTPTRASKVRLWERARSRRSPRARSPGCGPTT